MPAKRLTDGGGEKYPVPSSAKPKATAPKGYTSPRYAKPALKGPTKLEQRRVTSGPQSAKQKGLGPSAAVPRKRGTTPAKRQQQGGGIDVPKFLGEVGQNVNRTLDSVVPGRTRGTQVRRAMDTGLDPKNPLKKILKK